MDTSMAGQDEGAVFEILQVSDEVSSIMPKRGDKITYAQRCCEHCAMITGTIGHRHDGTPITINGLYAKELKPLNDEALAVVVECDAYEARILTRIERHRSVK